MSQGPTPTLAPAGVRGPLLLMLAGAPAAGKRAWAKRHFAPSELVSTQDLRRQITDDPGDRSEMYYTGKALVDIVNGRIGMGRTTVVDAFDADPKVWQEVKDRGLLFTCVMGVVVFNVGLAECLERNARRAKNLRWPVQALVEAHARVEREYPVQESRPGEFSFGLWVGGDTHYLGGFVVPQYRGGSWLDGARIGEGEWSYFRGINDARMGMKGGDQ